VSSVKVRLDFSYQLAPRLVNDNGKMKSHADCFEILSELLTQAIGLREIEPISCMVS